MKFSDHLRRFTRFSTITLLTGVWFILPAAVQAAEPVWPVPQRVFASPDDAVKALQTAVQAMDTESLSGIFGPEYRQLVTGDAVQDANNAAKLAAHMADGCAQVKEGDDKITLEIGTNNWPMPIPLIKTSGQWRFDTAAGRQEIINRHIGKDELYAIGVCRAYVVAQKQYADMNPKVGGGAKYAQMFKSTPGKKDGLYWPAADNEPASPFGPLVAESHVEGFGRHLGTGTHPFHGYYFRILTAQGAAAPNGTLDYMSEGVLAGGFALVAYPEHWDHSGIMTFIVNRDGKVYQRNLGEDTSRIAEAMKEYNPGGDWTLVPDEGVMSAVSER